MEPSCYKVEMERERAMKLMLWMEVTPGKITAHLPKDDQAFSGTKIINEIERSTSETLVGSSTYEGYEIKRTKSKYIIEDIVSPISSAGSLAHRSLFRKEVEDAEINLEDLIPLTRTRGPGLSRSCINICNFVFDQLYPPVRSTSSCHEFLTHSDVRSSRTLNFEGLQLYNDARIIFQKYMNSLILMEDLQDVEQQFIFLYPNYWKHLLKKCHVHMDPKIASEEQEALKDIAETCTGTLEDEMEIEKRDSIRDIGLSGTDVMDDFRTSIMYLKTKYPYLFAYMVRKHDFEKFTKERLKVDRNRFEIKKLLELEPAKLAGREERYSAGEWPRSISYF